VSPPQDLHPPSPPSLHPSGSVLTPGIHPYTTTTPKRSTMHLIAQPDKITEMCNEVKAREQEDEARFINKSLVRALGIMGKVTPEFDPNGRMPWLHFYLSYKLNRFRRNVEPKGDHGVLVEIKFDKRKMSMLFERTEDNLIFKGISTVIWETDQRVRLGSDHMVDCLDSLKREVQKVELF